MTLAEFNAVIDRRLAWRVIVRGGAALFTAGFAFFSALIIPYTYVTTLKYRADESDRNIARLEDQFKGLATTVGKLQLGVAEMRSEVKANRGDAAAIKAGVDLLLQQRSAALPARTAIAPTRRTQ